MARVERSTSSGGKRYLTDKVVAFDTAEGRELKLGGADNGNGLLEIYDDTDTLFVTADKEGLKLSNGAKLIGSTGALSTIIVTGTINSVSFLGGSALLPMGYSISGAGYTKDSLVFEFTMPSNLTITSAVVTINHIPVKYYDSGVFDRTGYSRALKLYKGTGFTGGYMTLDGDYALTTIDNYGTYTEISSAFGSGGFTGSSTGYTTSNSIDIKSSLVSGYNLLRIQTGNALVTTGNALREQTGACNAVLTITGYTY